MNRRLTVSRDSEPQQVIKDAAVNPFELASVLIRHKRVIALCMFGVMFLTAGITLLIPNKYVSTATILPSGGTDKMADLKSLAGLSGLVSQDESGSELYPVILSSHTIRDAVLSTDYAFVDDDQKRHLTLPEYFDQEDPDELRRALGDITTVSHDKKTGVISLAVETEYPAFSQAILKAYLGELETFNLHKRRSQAGERAKYLERELTQCKADLQRAEDSLAIFQASNRDWMATSDPELAVLIARLQRDVQTRNQTYLYLLQEFEVAKLDARKDVPVVRILDQPTLPTVKSSPQRTMVVLLLGMLSLVGAVFGVLVAEAIRRSAKGPDGPALETFRADLTREFPRVNRLLGRISAGTRDADPVGK